jgi:hypothetical protein
MLLSMPSARTPLPIIPEGIPWRDALCRVRAVGKAATTKRGPPPPPTFHVLHLTLHSHPTQSFNTFLP